ncbi:hypothetical protein B8V81_5059 [Paenibacillus pasadenensis]|uniref:Uncharacterized protein n=2 Tax=Paenibacillus pasadenensis TaxID=217090 RepID=A0A2N5MZL5_9BACL|nr:hypothetical protein B8V81_5059 [Paenibacillus pasadenensis]
MTFTVFQADFDMHELQTEQVKFTAQEAAAAAAQYMDPEAYADGRFVFNREEGIQAAEALIRQNLKLDPDFMPLRNSYASEQVTYTIEFFDDDSVNQAPCLSGYPCLYVQHISQYTLAITHPTVIVSIDAGEAQYSLRLPGMDTTVYRTGAHEWKGYNFIT